MLRDSEYVICGDGYNGVADTLEAAHALAERMDGGTVYVKAERMAILQAERDALLWWAWDCISYLENRYNVDYDTMQDQWKLLEKRLRTLASPYPDAAAIERAARLTDAGIDEAIREAGQP